MSMIYSADTDYRVCQISFDTLLEVQAEAEDRGWATRWTSAEALRGQVKDEVAIIQSLMREEREGVVHAYRCLLLFSAMDGSDAGAITTIDLDATRFQSLERLDRDPDVRKALAHMFSLALGGISSVPKR
jgi:hypothetical protein